MKLKHPPFFLFILFITSLSNAQTNVSGLIDSNTTWLISGSPYIITGNTLVDDNVQLSISPGVEIRFDSGKSLQVRGSLNAAGSSSAKIIFTANSFIPSPGYWQGITLMPQSMNYNFSNGQGNLFKNCVFEYSNEPLDLSLCTALVDSCIFRYNADRVIDAHGGDPMTSNRLQFSNNIFHHNMGDCIYINGTFSQTSVHNNIFCFNGPTGPCCQFASFSPTISEFYGNIIADNNCRGLITIFPFNIHHNNFVKNSNTDYVVYTGSGQFHHNLVTQNNFPFALNYTAACNANGDTLNYCNIFNNSGMAPFYELANDNSVGLPDVNAKNNWFGTSISAEIDNLIYDWFDDATRSIIDYQPYLTEPDQNAPISPPTGVLKKDLGNGSMLIKWKPNPEMDIAGYKIHFGPFNGYSFTNTIDAGNTHQYLITGVNFSDTIAITAYDDDTTGIRDLQTGHASWFSKWADSASVCSAFYLLYPDTIPLHYILENHATGIGVISYQWNWGDGSSVDTVPYPSHVYNSPGFYQICLTITDNSGCADSICNTESIFRISPPMVYVNVVPPISSSVTEFHELNITLFPNPATSSFVVNIHTELVKQMLIFGADGKLQPINFSNNDSRLVVDVSTLPSGIYYVQLVLDSGVYFRKFLKL